MLEKVAVMLLGRTSNWPAMPRAAGLMAARLQDRRRGPLQQAGRLLLPGGRRTTKGSGLVTVAASSSVPKP